MGKDLYRKTADLVSDVTLLLGIDENSQFDLFAERIDSYLDRLNSWKQEFELANPLAGNSTLSNEARATLRAAVEELQREHGLLMAKVDTLRQDVGGQITELHKRSKALRSYIDPFPKRVTITGKRTG